LVTLRLIVDVMTPFDEIFVVAVALNVVVAFVFHVIVSFKGHGVPLANVELLIFAGLERTFPRPPGDPPPLQAWTAKTTLIVCTVGVDVRPDEVVIVALGFPHVVPPPRLRVRRSGRRSGHQRDGAMVNEHTFLVQRPLSLPDVGLPVPWFGTARARYSIGAGG
jgi:hypothetical protein